VESWGDGCDATDRPWPYTDKNSIFRAAGRATLPEQWREKNHARTSDDPQDCGSNGSRAKKKVRRRKAHRALFETPGRLVRKLRLAGIDTMKAAQSLFGDALSSGVGAGFTVTPRNPRNAHRRQVEKRLKKSELCGLARKG